MILFLKSKMNIFTLNIFIEKKCTISCVHNILEIDAINKPPFLNRRSMCGEGEALACCLGSKLARLILIRVPN